MTAGVSGTGALRSCAVVGFDAGGGHGQAMYFVATLAPVT